MYARLSKKKIKKKKLVSYTFISCLDRELFTCKAKVALHSLLYNYFNG